MAEENRLPSENVEPLAGAADNTDVPEQEASAAGPDLASENARVGAELQVLRAGNTELRDKNLRLVAEMENLRRRTERDKAEFSKYAISEFARDIVGVGDNIRRAIESMPKETAAADPALRSVLEGVEVTERELLKVLERYQVTRFNPLGEPFNPHLHEAMTKVEAPNVPADTVVQVIHAGYMIGERVLRPAAVIVAKGGGAVDQPKSGGENSADIIPPGAVKVPDNAVSSAEAARLGDRQDHQPTVFARHLSEKRRPTLHREALSGENTVVHVRRPQRVNGNGTNGRDAPHPQSAQAYARPASLHKPVIVKRD